MSLISFKELSSHNFKLSIIDWGISFVFIVPSKNISGVVSNWIHKFANVVKLGIERPFSIFDK